MTTPYRDSTDPVGEYVVATCPDCGLRYGRHDDGACPDCGTALRFEDDGPALLSGGFGVLVRQLAQRHAPNPDDMHAVCRACCEGTPLALTDSSDVHKVSEFDHLVEDCERLVDRAGSDPHWVRPELVDDYNQAYREALPAPEHCFVCTEAVAHDDVECGHKKYGLGPCPARE